MVVQGPGMGEGPEAADMLSTLQAMSAHGGLMGGLPGGLNNPMQPPFPQQVLSPTWIQMNVIMLFCVQTHFAQSPLALLLPCGIQHLTAAACRSDCEPSRHPTLQPVVMRFCTEPSGSTFVR